MGLLIAADPTSGKLVVLAPIQGGPADRAGIQPGDEVSRLLQDTLPWEFLQGCMMRVAIRDAWRMQGQAVQRHDHA